MLMHIFRAHGTISALADRIKIARSVNGDSSGTEINLSVQHMLNCGKELGGTCKGGHPAVRVLKSPGYSCPDMRCNICEQRCLALTLKPVTHLVSK